MIMMDEDVFRGILLPCPFCAGPAKAIHYNGTWQGTCAGDHNCGGTDVLVPVAGWNTRRAAWKTMDSAPRDGTSILLLTTSGIIEGWFSQGEWSNHHEFGREYSGSAWVCHDDAVQIEVEEYPDDCPEGLYGDQPALFWMERPSLPEGIAGHPGGKDVAPEPIIMDVEY